MTERNPNESKIVDELKELGRQLTATVKAVAGSEQVRSLGQELREGLREATQSVDETLDKVREREEVQRLRARASDVVESFKTGEAQRDIREEVGAAIQALNVRLRDLVAQLQGEPDNGGAQTPPDVAQTPPATDETYTGETRRLDS
jgi:uncharacterized coiled-coil DUF342 family protein